MALQKQDVVVALGTGVETKQDAKLVQPGKLLVCENSNIDIKTGSSFKRFGHDSLPTETTGRGDIGSFYAPDLTNVQKVATLNNELVAITDKALFGYSEAMQKWAWKGYCGNVTAESEAVYRSSLDAVASDTRILNGYMVVASYGVGRGTGVTASGTSASDGIIITVLDEKTQKVINERIINVAGATPVNVAQKVRCVIKGDFVFAYFLNLGPATATLRLVKVDTTNPEIIPGVTVYNSTDIQTFDVCEVGDEVVVVTATRAASFTVTLSYVKDDGTSGGIADGLPANPINVATGFGTGTAPGGLSVCSVVDGVNDAIYVNYADNAVGSGFSYTVYNLAFGSPRTGSVLGTGDLVCHSIVGIGSGSQAYIFYSGSDSIINAPYVTFGVLSYEISILGVDSVYAMPIIGSAYSKPLLYNGDFYIITTNTNYGTEQKSYFLLRSNLLESNTAGFTTQTTFLPVCQMLVNEGINDSYYEGYGNSIVLNSDGDYVVTLQRAFAVVNATSTNIKTAHLTTATKLKFNDPNAYQVVEKENCLYISAGILFVYDGNYVFENGFLHYPVISQVVANGGAASVPVGTHTYQSTYEWSDRSGNKHISAPSLNKSITLASAQTVSVQTVYQGMTYKQFTFYFTAIKDCGINVYRTALNSTVRYRATVQSPEPAQNNATYAVRNQFIDDVTDADLKTREILYTNGGVIENIATGSAGSIEDYQGRLLLSNREDGNTILFSKQKRPTLAYQFNPDLLFTVREDTARVLAAKVLDDKVVLFKESSIYVQAGQGPTDTGENSDYLQNPQRIASNVGCPYPKSIVRFNDGLAFKSFDGFYLLTRGLELKKIGEPVDYYNSLTVREGVLMEDRNEIRWVHSDGVCLIFDYFQEQWYTYTNHESVSCTVWKKLFVMAKTDGAIWVENKSTYLDDGVAYRRRVVTPWFAMGGLQHAERLYRILLLGEMRSPHILTCYVAYDYEPARRETFTFNSFDELGAVSLTDAAYYDVPPTYSTQNRTYDIEMRPTIQKCESFRLELYDENDLDNMNDPIDGGCAVWTSLTMTVGVKRSTLRPSSNRRADPT